MKVSLRIKLQRAIADYSILALEFVEDADAKMSALSKDERVKIHDELARLQEVLDVLWKEAKPFMNAVEQARYADQIKNPSITGAVNAGVMNPECAAFLAKVRRVFPNARVVNKGAGREQRPINHGVSGDKRPDKFEEEIVPIKRDEGQQAEPERPRKPEQKELF